MIKTDMNVPISSIFSRSDQNNFLYGVFASLTFFLPSSTMDLDSEDEEEEELNIPVIKENGIYNLCCVECVSIFLSFSFCLMRWIMNTST